MPGSSHHFDPRRGIPDHELIRCIGRGAYGEVWLARNTLGTYRAVKIVYVASFECAEPYEREFRGVFAYEPLSREHPGLVDILHVGRDDRSGCFYYVMELADDARRGQDIEPTTYQARTLSGELQRRGRLSPRKTLSIGLDLCEALGAIHRAGLVHRDVKPSNIIFVNGKPKLADIGLVAVASAEPSTYVGTEGFLPPEGPGSPLADLYALGMVLYVTGTGLRPTEFPNLPTKVLDQPNPTLLQLNQIILNVCDRDPGRRFQTAEEMRLALAAALASAEPDDETEVLEVSTPLSELPGKASPDRPLQAKSMLTGEITMVARQPLPTGHFKGTEWEQIAAVQDTSIVLARSRQQLQRDRARFDDYYATLHKQATHAHRLWVICAFIGFLAMLAGMVILIIGHLVQGISVAALSTPVYFIMRAVGQRGDAYRAQALALTNSFDRVSNEQWEMLVMKGERRQRLAEAIREKVLMRSGNLLSPVDEAASRTACQQAYVEFSTRSPQPADVAIKPKASGNAVSDAGSGGELHAPSQADGPPGIPLAPLPDAPADDVRFSAFAPHSVAPEMEFLVDVWAYLDSQLAEVQARGSHGGQHSEAGSMGPIQVERGVKLEVHLNMPGFEVERCHAWIWWNGKPANAPSIVRCNRETTKGTHLCSACIQRNGVPIALLPFDVVVGEREDGRRMFDGRRVRSAFASYSSLDRDDVLLWVSGARTFGVDIFVDVLDLRAGEHWEEHLLAYLKEKDLFCLFWSKPASESKEVEREWRAALKERGIHYIHPVPFADPRDVPPPQELQQCKHFNDLLLRMYEYERERKRRAAGESARPRPESSKTC